MAILEGIRIQNYRSLKDITLGQTFEQQRNKKDVLPRLMAVIGANGVGKSTLLDALGFLGDCLGDGVEAACDKVQRGGFERLRTAGVCEPIRFEVRFRQTGGFKLEVQHLPPIKVRRCRHLVRLTSSFNLKIASPLPA